MTKLLRTLCGIFITLSLTGCIEIFEELTLEKNGNGHFREKIDMSGAAGMLNMMKSSNENAGENGSTNGEAAQNTDPSQAFMEKWQQLKEMPGIENVRIVRDTVRYKYMVEFDFDNGQVLNDAIKVMQGKEESREEFYSISKSSLTRSDKDLNGALEQEVDDGTAEMTKTMMSDMKYNLSVTVPGKIKSVSNKSAEIVGNNTVKMVASFEELLDKKKSLGIKISYK